MKLAKTMCLTGLLAKLTEEENSDKGPSRSYDEKMIKVYYRHAASSLVRVSNIRNGASIACQYTCLM